MRILFGALHFTYFRNFESVLCALAEQGHDIHVFADEEEALGGRQLMERLAAASPRITWGFAPSLEEWHWTPLARKVRRALEYVRFQDPQYDPTPKYRYRSEERAPRLLRWLFGTPALNTRWTRQLVASCLTWLEKAIPTCPALDAFVARYQPDVVALASVTNPGGLQIDHLKSAKALGRRTAIPVWSWDHLSGKAWLRLMPDRVIVWNDVQRQEARSLHAVPDERIVVTGAQCYDQWFDRRPNRSRDAFCLELGLDPEKPVLLYVCSVLVRPAPSEAAFALEWVRQIRSSDDPSIRSAGIIIRPHPERAQEWNGLDIQQYGQVALLGRNPIDPAAKADYFDSLFHSTAVVGLVTSAFLEAAVVGRPVFTIERPEFKLHQEGTPHFQYLIGVNDGLLTSAPDLRRHVAQLQALFVDPRPMVDRSRRFVERFVRPAGLDRAATPNFVNAFVELARQPEPARQHFGPMPQRLVPALLDALTQVPLVRTALMSRRDTEDELASIARAERDAAAKSRTIAEVAARTTEKERLKQQRLERKETIRRQKESRKTDRQKDRARALAQTRRSRLKVRVKQLIGMER